MEFSFITDYEQEITWVCIGCSRYPKWYYWGAANSCQLSCKKCGWACTYHELKEDVIFDWNNLMEIAFELNYEAYYGPRRVVDARKNRIFA